MNRGPRKEHALRTDLRKTVRKSRKGGVKESAIQKQILFWLYGQGIFCWYVKTVGTYDPTKKVFRSTPWYYRKGVPDIHGFAKYRPFVIEVKSATGRLSPDQIQFAKDYELETPQGAVHIVAKSLEDVQEAFKTNGLI